jgi:hypothetical protein
MTTVIETAEEFLTLKGELERKLGEELERLIHAQQRGEITRYTLKACMQTIWNITAGLIERDLMNAVASAVDSQKDIGPDPVIWFFLKGKQAVIVMWVPGSTTVSTYIPSLHTVRTWEAPEGYDRTLIAKRHLAQIYRALTAQGFEKV